MISFPKNTLYLIKEVIMEMKMPSLKSLIVTSLLVAAIVASLPKMATARTTSSVMNNDPETSSNSAKKSMMSGGGRKLLGRGLALASTADGTCSCWTQAGGCSGDGQCSYYCSDCTCGQLLCVPPGSTD